MISAVCPVSCNWHDPCDSVNTWATDQPAGAERKIVRYRHNRFFARGNLVWIVGVVAGVIAGGIVAYGLT